MVQAEYSLWKQMNQIHPHHKEIGYDRTKLIKLEILHRKQLTHN